VIRSIYCSLFQSEYILNYHFSFTESNGNPLSVLHKFIIGSEHIPPLGLPKQITAKFKHGCQERCRCRPTASTCDLSITLPVHYHNDYNLFKESIDSALIEGIGLGCCNTRVPGKKRCKIVYFSFEYNLVYKK
jgi:hypothetical protein